MKLDWLSTILVYALVEIISIIFFHFADVASSNKKKNFFLIVGSLPIILLIGLRSINTGADTRTYYKSAYLPIIDNKLSTSDWISFGYIALCRFTSFVFGNSFSAFNIIIAALTMLFFVKAIKKETSNTAFALFVLFATCLVFEMMNQSRQMLSASIVLYAITFAREKKIIWFTLLILLAASIHTSALIVLPFYFLAAKKFNKKSAMIYLLSMTALLLLSNQILSLIARTSYGHVYSSSSYYRYSIENAMKCIVSILMAITYVIVRKNGDDKNMNNKDGYLHSSACCCLIRALSVRTYIIGRLAMFFYLPYTILLSDTYLTLKREKKKTALLCFIACLVAYEITYYAVVSAGAKYLSYEMRWM